MLRAMEEQDMRQVVAVARAVLATPALEARPGDSGDVAPEDEDELWRAVLRRLPAELEHLCPMDEDLRCPVCLGWLLEPVELGCPGKHMLCKSCCRRLPARLCPVDRQPFGSSAPAGAAEERLRTLPVRCCYAASGCGWEGPRGDLLDHCRDRCDHALFECRECAAHVRRREWGGHEHDPGAAEARTRMRERQEAARSAEIDAVLGIYEQAERLNACFLVDCTGSMGSHIRAVKVQILRIVHEMSMRLPSMCLHLAFVGYRDHTDSQRFEVLPFTTNPEEFKGFVAGISASGGGDEPEDVHGGLDTALGLEWSIGGAATRVLIHICDAPCHGTRYHSIRGDSYPQGDPHGLTSPDLLRRMKDTGLQYVFGRINGKTDQMVMLFDQEAGAGYVQTREMRDTRLVADAVTASLHASVATTVSTLSSARRSPARVRTSDEVPCWASVDTRPVELWRCRRASGFAELLAGASAAATRRLEPVSASVQLARLPFSQGETRAARHALLDGRPAVAKFAKGPAYEELCEDDGDEEHEQAAAWEACLCLGEVSAVASYLADQFSAGQETGTKVAFLESHAARSLDGSAPFNVEDALPAEEFRRYSNNIGWWEPDADPLLMRFTRWTHEATEGYMMVVDLQGVRTSDGFLLTDPCILCTDVSRFGSGNLGPRSLERCLRALQARLDAPPPPEEAADEPRQPRHGHVPTGHVPTGLVPSGHFDFSAPFEPERLRWGETPTTPAASLVPEPAAPTGSGFSAARVASSVARAGAAVARTVRGTGPARGAESLPRGDGEALDLDAILTGLLVPQAQAARGARLPSTSAILALLAAARELLLSQPMLLELEAPLRILGDVHGQFPDLLRLLDIGGALEQSYLLLGDYVDRGKQSLETMVLLLAMKLKRPENVFLLRGNHECGSISRIYGFYDECKRRANIRLWKRFIDLFNCLPVAAVVDSKIFCCHGGPSPELGGMDDVRRLARPADVPDSGLLCDLLWADPDEGLLGWAENDRGVSYTFGPDVVASLLEREGLELVARAHQVVEDGYEFFAARRLVTIFSAPDYCGEFNNHAALMVVEEDLRCSFELARSMRG
mmetsp:Transcript_41651/g.118799  ORF Transcript_41651/g.118799 Transcript_41651/m.118799 type:complete len:1081 (-) Transcript_41651:19-3261(-)